MQSAGMQAVAKEVEEGRLVFCETHNRYCELDTGNKCACCGKRVCLCNYVL
jgi:hypothetical protein